MPSFYREMSWKVTILIPIPMYGFFFSPHQGILWQLQGVLQFSSNLTLSIQWHQIPQGEGSVPQDCSSLQIQITSKSRLSPTDFGPTGYKVEVLINLLEFLIEHRKTFYLLDHNFNKDNTQNSQMKELHMATCVGFLLALSKDSHCPQISTCSPVQEISEPLPLGFYEGFIT